MIEEETKAFDANLVDFWAEFAAIEALDMPPAQAAAAPKTKGCRKIRKRSACENDPECKWRKKNKKTGKFCISK